MRRFILIFMLCLLPLQWSWAAAARVCEHEQGAAHFGHHEHRHAADAAPDSSTDAAASAALQPHPDCHTCHGLGAGFLPTLDAPPVPWASGSLRPYHSTAFPEPPPGSLLRPPSSFVA